MAPGKFEWNFRHVIFKQILVIDGWLRHLLWNCPNMNVTGLHWWSVNIGSGDGLVPSGNKPLPEPMLTQISVRHHWCAQWLCTEQHLGKNIIHIMTKIINVLTHKVCQTHIISMTINLIINGYGTEQTTLSPHLKQCWLIVNQIFQKNSYATFIKI